MYVTVQNGTNFYDITYIVFYPYNGPTSKIVTGLGAHEGDLEHVTVRLRLGTDELMGIFFSAHGSDESVWVPLEQIEYVDTPSDGRHFVVYSARSSHANYPKAKSYDRIARDLGPIKLHFAADECKDGFRWNSWDNIINVGTYESPLNGQTWVRYNGRWGRFKETGCFGVSTPFGDKVCFVDYPDEDGPTNLARKSWFLRLHEGGPQ